MKKIMIAAAVAAIGFGAFASSDCGEVVQKDAAWVYKWKFSGKSTVGKKTTVAASVCKDGGDADCTIRVPGSLKIQGYTYFCNPACGDFESFDEDLEVFYMKKPYKTYLYGGVTTEIANIIGAKKKQSEVYGVATFNDPATLGTYSLTYAGLGKYKSGRISSVSGNFAGTLDQPYYVPKAGKCIPAGYWDCDFALVCNGGATPAYGKWSAKFKKSAAKKFAKNSTPVKLPKYVTKQWPNRTK